MRKNALFVELESCGFPAKTVSLAALLPSFPLPPTEKPWAGMGTAWGLHRVGTGLGLRMGLYVFCVCVQHLLCGPLSPYPLLLG